MATGGPPSCRCSPFLPVYTLRETEENTLLLVFPADPRIPAYNGLAAAAGSPPEPPVAETDILYMVCQANLQLNFPNKKPKTWIKLVLLVLLKPNVNSKGKF